MLSPNSCISVVIAPMLLCNALNSDSVDVKKIAPQKVDYHLRLEDNFNLLPLSTCASDLKLFNFEKHSPNEIVEIFAEKITSQTIDIDHDLATIVHQNFWDLI